MSARSDEPLLEVVFGAAVATAAGAANALAAEAAVAAVGLAIGVCVVSCANKVPESAIEQIERRNNFFISV